MVFKKSVFIVTAALTAYLPTVSVSMERDWKDDAWFKQAGERMEREKPQTDAWFKQAGERMKSDPFFQKHPTLQSFGSSYLGNNNSPSNSGIATYQPSGFSTNFNNSPGNNPGYGLGSSFNSQQPIYNSASPFSSQSKEQEARRQAERQRQSEEETRRQIEQEARLQAELERCHKAERQRQIEQEARRQIEQERRQKEEHQRQIEQEARRQKEEKILLNKETIVSEESNIESKPVQLEGELTPISSIEAEGEEDEITVDGHTLYWVNGNLYGVTDQDQIDVGGILKKAGHQSQFDMLEAIKVEKKYDSDEQIIAILKALLIWDNDIKK